MILIAFGGNLPAPDGTQPIETFKRAVAELSRDTDLVPARFSRLYRSPPIPVSDQPDYVNAVVAFTGKIEPAILLAQLHAVEHRHGRVRSAPNGARSLDLDLLDLNGTIRPSPDPVLPHPRLTTRAFVLLPLKDAAPTYVHPVTLQRIDNLIARLPPQEIEVLPATW